MFKYEIGLKYKMNKNKVYITKKSDLKDFLKYESEKYGFKNSNMPLVCIREVDYLYKYNVLLRKTEYYINTGKRIRGNLFKILLNRYGNKNHIHIPINTFDKGLKLMHLGPILVNSRVRAGKDIALHINTSIVAGGSNDYTPIIEDGCVIGVGAVILGKVHLAKNIAVGANSVVNKSFYEENIAIAGVPAKKISNNGRLNWNRGKYNKEEKGNMI